MKHLYSRDNEQPTCLMGTLTGIHTTDGSGRLYAHRACHDRLAHTDQQRRAGCDRPVGACPTSEFYHRPQHVFHEHPGHGALLVPPHAAPCHAQHAPRCSAAARVDGRRRSRRRWRRWRHWRRWLWPRAHVRHARHAGDDGPARRRAATSLRDQHAHVHADGLGEDAGGGQCDGRAAADGDGMTEFGQFSDGRQYDEQWGSDAQRRSDEQRGYTFEGIRGIGVTPRAGRLG